MAIQANRHVCDDPDISYNLRTCLELTYIQNSSTMGD